jgi:hypothetical protein
MLKLIINPKAFFDRQEVFRRTREDSARTNRTWLPLIDDDRQKIAGAFRHEISWSIGSGARR